MSAPRPLIAAYALGVTLFLAGLVLLALNALAITELNAAIVLIVGFVLMFGSKFAVRALQKGPQS